MSDRPDYPETETPDSGNTLDAPSRSNIWRYVAGAAGLILLVVTLHLVGVIGPS